MAAEDLPPRVGAQVASVPEDAVHSCDPDLASRTAVLGREEAAAAHAVSEGIDLEAERMPQLDEEGIGARLWVGARGDVGSILPGRTGHETVRTSAWAPMMDREDPSGLWGPAGL